MLASPPPDLAAVHEASQTALKTASDALERSKEAHRISQLALDQGASFRRDVLSLKDLIRELSGRLAIHTPPPPPDFRSLLGVATVVLAIAILCSVLASILCVTLVWPRA